MLQNLTWLEACGCEVIAKRNDVTLSKTKLRLGSFNKKVIEQCFITTAKKQYDP